MLTAPTRATTSLLGPRTASTLTAASPSGRPGSRPAWRLKVLLEHFPATMSRRRLGRSKTWWWRRILAHPPSRFAARDKWELLSSPAFRLPAPPEQFKPQSRRHQPSAAKLQL